MKLLLKELGLYEITEVVDEVRHHHGERPDGLPPRVKWEAVSLLTRPDLRLTMAGWLRAVAWLRKMQSVDTISTMCVIFLVRQKRCKIDSKINGMRWVIPFWPRKIGHPGKSSSFQQFRRKMTAWVCSNLAKNHWNIMLADKIFRLGNFHSIDDGN